MSVKGQPIAARRIRIKCPNCGRTSGADEVRHEESPPQTNHDCPHCAATMLTVTTSRGTGYRLRAWTVNPLGGMSVDASPTEDAV